ncbi:uncharacterized protein LOC111634359 [Centruroides sculpturatus]|uniref:uncharacterized protein LOC111634359 n=1 Tax=Centruroides sculpturatus TaxID=218467 RepID=UPI000C6EC007|nr:uncharacterized protein LOC111634359 [Centruroides sculpturatus]
MFPRTPPEALKHSQEERKGTKHHRSPSDPGIKYPKLEHYFKRQSPPDSDREELLTLCQYLETTLNAVMMQLKCIEDRLANLEMANQSTLSSVRKLEIDFSKVCSRLDKLEQQHQLPLDDIGESVSRDFQLHRSRTSLVRVVIRNHCGFSTNCSLLDYMIKRPGLICLALVETWMISVDGDFLANFLLVNWRYFMIPAEKPLGPGRPHGGILFFFDEVRVHFKLLETYPDLMVIGLSLYSVLDSRNILVLVVYAGSQRQQGLRLDLFSSILNSWSSYYHGIVIMGDFNVHIGEGTDSHLNVASPNIFDVRRSKDLKVGTAGRQFLRWLIEHDFILLNGRTKRDFPGELTFLSKVESLRVGSLSSSDHFPVELQLSTGNRFSFVDVLCPIKTRYVWNDSKVELFGDAVSQSFRNINFDSVSVDFLKVLNLIRRIRPPWFDRSCYIQKRARNIALGKFRRSNSQADLASFLNLKRQYNSLIRAKKRKYFSNYALQLARIRDSKTFWYRIGRFRRVRRILDQEISSTDWFTYYQQLFSLNTSNLPPILSLPMASFVVPILDHPISDTEVNTALQKMRIRSAPGVDNVSPSLIVYSKNTLVPYLAKLFNRVYDTARIPKSWLEVKIKVIHKKGPLDEPANFRPVSLLPVVRKIFTSILANRLGIWLRERNLIQSV